MRKVATAQLSRAEFSFVDFYTSTSEVGGGWRKGLVMADGGHPTAEGHALMFKQIPVDYYTN